MSELDIFEVCTNTRCDEFLECKQEPQNDCPKFFCCNDCKYLCNKCKSCLRDVCHYKAKETSRKMKVESLKEWSKEMKILLLRALDFDSDGIYVLDKQRKKVLDRYTNEPVKIDKMAILPTEKGIVIINWNPLSFASFLEEFKEFNIS